MKVWIVLAAGAALTAAMVAPQASRAQSAPAGTTQAAASGSNSHWTVLTMTPDGSWGAATGAVSGRAIASAIAGCKWMSEIEIGCGAYSRSVQNGWILGIRCGSENIIATGRNLKEAERHALVRERELRVHYSRNMPPCVRVVAIDPNGVAASSPAGRVERMSSSQ